MKLYWLIITAFSISLSSCSEAIKEEPKTDTPKNVTEPKKKDTREPLRAESPADVNLREGEEFLAENAKKEGVTVLESGLQYEVLTEGSGAIPMMVNHVTVHYHGTHLDGSVFDSSVDRNQPYSHDMTGSLIKGWVEALLHMPTGSKWRVYMPANSAYGAWGSSPAIGPNEALIFEIELISINS